MDAGECDLLRECSQGKGNEGHGIGERGELSKDMDTGVQLRPDPTGALEHGKHHRVGPCWAGRLASWLRLSVRHCGQAAGGGRAEAQSHSLEKGQL